MSETLTIALVVTAIPLALWSLVLVVRNQPLGNALFYGISVVELVTLVVVAIIVVTLIGGDRPDGMATFVSYLVLLPLVLPVATLWALIERSRWGSAVIAVAALVLPVLALRLEQIWATGG